jgi:hypothetical protein
MAQPFIATANPQQEDLKIRLIQSLAQVESDRLNLTSRGSDAYSQSLRQQVERLKAIANLKPVAN